MIATTAAFIYFKDKAKGLLLLIFIVSGLAMHSWLFIETYFNEFTFNTLQLKNIIAETNICL